MTIMGMTAGMLKISNDVRLKLVTCIVNQVVSRSVMSNDWNNIELLQAERKCCKIKNN